jgi:hypothetical protein
MPRSPAPGDDAVGPLDFDRAPAARRRAGLDARLAFEDAAVRHVCALLGRPRLAQAIARESRERTEAGACNFPLFEATCPDFPVRLRVGALRAVKWIAVADLYNHFARTPVGLALAELLGEVDPDDGPWGLVFRWAGARDSEGRQHAIKGGRFMVAHTAPALPAAGRVLFAADLKVGDARYPVALERLDDLVGRLGLGFDPDG